MSKRNCSTRARGSVEEKIWACTRALSDGKLDGRSRVNRSSSAAKRSRENSTSAARVSGSGKVHRGQVARLVAGREGPLEPVEEGRRGVGGHVSGGGRRRGRERHDGDGERAAPQDVASAGRVGLGRGRVTLNTLPRPGWLSTSIVPWCSRTISRAR